MPPVQQDRQFMERALALAEKGRGLTNPNPLVGAVLVADGRIQGEGYHAGAGREHAEVVAMREAVGAETTGKLSGSTLYVTLEPCCHEGRTPPCVDAIVASGIGRVVVAAVDPSPRVNWKGVKGLRAAGIEVVWAEGDLSYRAKRQNDAFRRHVLQGLPFVTYKYAMTLDGRTAAESGHSRWISGEESRERVHRMRSWSDAVLVGAGTVREDDPTLTVRGRPVEKQPVRAVIDPSLSISLESNLMRTVDQGPVMIVCSRAASPSARRSLENAGAEVVEIPDEDRGYPQPRTVARTMAERGLQSVLLEGGPTLAGAWWDEGLIDRVVAFVAPVLVGGPDSPGPLPGEGFPRMDVARRLRDVEISRSGPDVEVSGYFEGPA